MKKPTYDGSTTREPAKEIGTEGVKTIKTPVVEPVKYRYYCDACTGIAFYSAEIEPKKDVVCGHCGKHIGPAKPENYIKL